jgi:hypothetical protein
MRKPSPSTQGWKPISKRRTRRPILFCQSLQVSDKPAASRTIHLASTLPCWSPIWPIECLSLRGEIRRFQAFRAIKVLICVAVPFLMVSCRPNGTCGLQVASQRQCRTVRPRVVRSVPPSVDRRRSYQRTAAYRNPTDRRLLPPDGSIGR